MKALFTVIFIAIFGLQNAMAQASKTTREPLQAQSCVGLKGGVNVASVSNLNSSHAFLGFHAGVLFEKHKNSEFGYGIEALYSKQGVTASNLDFSLNYLSLPLFLNLYHGKFTFQGGAYGSILFVATANLGQEKVDITDNFSATDYGLLLGLRFQPTERTFVATRLNLGLQNINKDFAENKNAILRNRLLQIGAGYLF